MKRILKTEERNPQTMQIDTMCTAEIVDIMAEANFRAAEAVRAAAKEIGRAVDAVCETFSKGGRLFFIGAGTSGRLGVLEAAECPPTFGVSHEMVQGIIAGGEKSMFRAAENAEDISENGKADMRAHHVGKNDCVVGISAAGGAAYVVGAFQEAREQGATTVALTCNEDTPLEANADICIITDTGAEVITGSTRLKAGTAHKMVLNILTTAAMTKSGYVYENMMINLKPSNLKLRDRMIRIVCEILGCDKERAEALLEQNDWSIRKAAESGKGC